MVNKSTKNSKQEFKKDNPVIMITGAGKGIGRAIFLEFCDRVRYTNSNFLPRLVLVSRTKKDLELLKAEGISTGIDTLTFSGDISDLKFIDSVVSKVKKIHGSIDCLINNAGVGRFGDFLEFSEKDFDFVVDTNLKGTFFLTQQVFKDMAKQKAGHIIFITSVAAEKPFEQSAIYCLSKFAQKGFLEVLRLYGYKNNIRITNVMPGAVETPMWGVVTKDMRRRMMKPEDIAKAVVDAYLQPERTSVEEIVLRPIRGDL